ncbi:MAG TPA: response regulator [Panacibacter sp.]|nr:response regulator [Panacibacter sp.]HNP45253.1 response regulator [Panacibacter sp.]
MIKAIIIDDEVHCIDALSILLADYCPEVEIIEKCMSPAKGIEAIRRVNPDLVFLDIEMPAMNGFELLNQFRDISFSVIFTTSYDQYAIKAIRFSALDYLLKPVDPKELIAAVHKVNLQKPMPSVDQLKKLMDHIQVQSKESHFEKVAAMLEKNFPPLQVNNLSNQRRLAAILFTDIVGYTAMMQQSEERAVTVIKRHLAELQHSVSAHAGEVLNDYGDGSLSVFASATNAVHCAMELQLSLQKKPVVPLRVGLHIGEIFFEEGKILGDGVNVASRIQSLGIENSILFSSEIYDKIKNNSMFSAVSLGNFEFKNVSKAIEVFALANEGFTIPSKKNMEGKLKKRSWLDYLFPKQ